MKTEKAVFFGLVLPVDKSVFPLVDKRKKCYN
jgi:hypothetical protein